MFYKLNDSTILDVSNLKKANEDLTEALAEVNNLIGELGETNEWKGKTKDSILNLIMLCSKFHKDILDISNDNVNNLDNIIKKSDEFLVEDDILQKWR